MGRRTMQSLDAKLKALAVRKAYGGEEGKPSVAGEVVEYDIDVERGFTAVLIEVRVRNPKTGRMPSKSTRIVWGYAKRNNVAGDKQNEEIGLSRALADAIKRAVGIPRLDPQF